MDEKIVFGLYQSCENWGVLGVDLCFGCSGVGGVGWECVWSMDKGLGWRCYVCVR